MVISVSTTASAALAPWLEQAKIIVGAVGLVAVSIGAFILLIMRQLMQGIRRSGQRLRGQKLQLDTALNNMSQGLLMVDAAGSRDSLQQALHGDVRGARRHAGARLQPAPSWSPTTLRSASWRGTPRNIWWRSRSIWR